MTPGELLIDDGEHELNPGRQKLAITVHTRSGRSWNRNGPGVIPLMMNAPISTAIVGELGMPSVRNGIIAALAYALFADSGAATPSIAPCPKRSGVFDRRFSTM